MQDNALFFGVLRDFQIPVTDHIAIAFGGPYGILGWLRTVFANVVE